MFNPTRSAPALLVFAACAGALGQASHRAAFVANNGNAEGSVTAYTFDAAGAPVFVGKYITGSGSGNPGNNAYAISLTPDGRHLITTHATANTVTEQITLFRVNADATLTQLAVFGTPNSPLAATWLSSTHLAVTLTDLGGPNKVIVYRFDEAAMTMTEIDRENSGGFTGYLALHPTSQYLYAQDSPLGSGAYVIKTFRVHPDGELDYLGETYSAPTYALGPGVTPDGRRLYAGGGAISGSNSVVGFDILPDGTLAMNSGSPWISPGSSPSPKQAVPSTDGKFVFVGHGRSAEVRSFAVDQSTGWLTDTGFAFDVGGQGDLGGVAVLGDLMLLTRRYTGAGPTGLFSFTVQPDGNMIANGPVVGSQGSLPQYIAAWDPGPGGCYANCDASTTDPVLNVADFSCFLQRFASGDAYANCDQSTGDPVLNVADFSCFLQSFASGCE